MESINPNNWERWPVNDNVDDSNWWWFEKVDVDFWHHFSKNYGWAVVLTTIPAYWSGILLLKYFMKHRKPYANLTGIIAAYNIAMTLFSVQCLIKMLPLLTDEFDQPGWLHRRLCYRSSKLTKRIFFWAVAIGWSKVVQTLDSFFRILLKKDVPFFQVYHHSVTILVPFLLFDLGEPVMVLSGMTNLIQHSITYPYFAFKVLKIRLPGFVPKIILIVELAQMIFGLTAGLYTLYIIHNGGYCIRHPKSIRLINFLYLTMLVLVACETYSHFTKPRKRVKKE